MEQKAMQMDDCTDQSLNTDAYREPPEELIDDDARQRERRCDCCELPVSQLKPFGKAGDPLVGDFEGALLVKTWRPWAPDDEEAERIYEEYLERARSELHYEKTAQRVPADYDMEEAELIRLRVDERVAELMSADYVRKKAELIRLDAEERAEQLLAADYGTEEAEPMFPDYSTNEEARRIRAVEDRAKQLMAQDLGTERAKRIMDSVHDAGAVDKSWECRDCIVLSREEYFEKRFSRLAAEE